MTDYKNTLNLPNTTFSMKANLPITEVSILKSWNENNLYKIIRLKKNKKELFLLHDGPPYANGDIHLGHAVNKVLKDIILKSKGLSGYDAPYIPGWDCHGLPVELEVKQLIKKSNFDIDFSVRKFHDICRQYVIEQVNKQKEDFMRLGVLGDWNNPYLTMDFKIEANIIRTLNKIIDNGYLYKGIKPVYWCCQCRSALAHAEVEYRNHHSYAVDVGFSIVNNLDINKIFNVDLGSDKIELIIWTTTLWTLPANQAISVHPNYMYQLIKIVNNKYIIIASKLVHFFMDRIKCFSWKVLGETEGNTLEYLRVKHPFMFFDVPVILSNHIRLDSGTGIVHIAPNHGLDDYILAQKYSFKDSINLVDNKGYYLFNIHDKLNRLNIWDSNPIIIDLLYKSKNFLYVNPSYQHSYPYCWRHKVPLIFRATSQWFLNMNYNNLRNTLLQVSQKVDWIPNKGFFNMQSMICNRPDWCISRQRIWGIPIPVFIHKKTKKLHPNTFELIEKIAKLVEIYGIQIWWDLKIEDFILNEKEVSSYKKSFDTLDVWFDSGSTYDSVILEKFKNLKEKKIPINLYLEGLDQYRGWFMSSLIISVAINGKPPYKQVLSHGFIVDSQGNKMSKSLGNIIKPQDIIEKFGSDILRLWIASSDYSKEMIVSDDILKHTTDIYRRIRNTVRFCLSNLYDFNPKEHIIQSIDMIALDRWIIHHALSVQLKIISNYHQYQFHNVVQDIMKFCSIEMGSFYLDVIKDRQYTCKKDSLARRSCQTALYHILESLVRWITPILSFTADDIWKYIPGKRSKYVFTEEWYNGLFKIDENHYINSDYWNIFFSIRDKVNKIIEQARFNKIIKGSLEANITIYATSELANKLRMLNNELAFGLIVSSVTVLNNNTVTEDTINKNQKINIDDLKIILEKSKGTKCLRCWNYTFNVKKYKNYYDICSRCIQNIEGVGENRKFF